MQMTDGEKLLAVMLADVLKALESDGEIDPGFVTSAITSGNTWAFKWKYPGIFEDSAPDEDVVSEVGRILTMSSFVEYSISELSPEELESIPDNERQVFIGFDGNNEPHYGVATFLVEDLNRFSELKGRNMNSHMPMVAKYLRMAEAFDHVRGGLGPLSLQNIQTILSA
ncbi:YfbU family protein [Sphingomonas trueperi]|uniref:YfbU family protein n=1 Tax=Sphingomonas trueperi TaxID=53317 RepID=UPI000F1BC2BD